MPRWLQTWAPYVSVALFLLAVWLFQGWRRRRRKEGLADVAHRLGLTFEVNDWGSRSSGPQLQSRHFAHSYNQIFRNSLSGEREGLAASFFDHIVGGRGGHTDTIASFTQSIVLPEFALAQQDTLNKIGDVILHRQIDFPSAPGFAERFRLVGEEEDRVRELFTANMREFLGSIEADWRIEASGRTLVMYLAGYAVKPEEFPDFVDETIGMAKNFFSHCHLQKLPPPKPPY
jgi:hypothetical protein